jgi:hypothetical protein
MLKFPVLEQVFTFFDISRGENQNGDGTAFTSIACPTETDLSSDPCVILALAFQKMNLIFYQKYGTIKNS